MQGQNLLLCHQFWGQPSLPPNQKDRPLLWKATRVRSFPHLHLLPWFKMCETSSTPSYVVMDDNNPSTSMCIPGLVMQIGNLHCIKRQELTHRKWINKVSYWGCTDKVKLKTYTRECKFGMSGYQVISQPWWQREGQSLNPMVYLNHVTLL